ncbi:MAG: hypothetical protein IT374_25580 [Polyangiaceae bacterium]|nr:hypothetical protein [Polyangiaceae bacterium]
MSEVRTAALVCEGQTDVPVLRALLQAAWPELEDVLCLQPELDETDRAKGPAGWSQVKAWCEANAGRLDEVLDPDLGDRIDLLVIAIDVDIAIQAGIADPPRSVGVYETKRLRDTMTGWLSAKGRVALPSAIVLSTPVTAVEAWIISALFRNEASPESIKDPAQFLVEKKRLRKSPSDGKPWKELHLYRDDFAPRVAKELKRVRKVCSEADRTVRAVEQRRAQVEEADA